LAYILRGHTIVTPEHPAAAYSTATNDLCWL
jgi:hypothetical protein